MAKKPQSEWQRNYNASEKGKAAQARYHATGKGKDSIARARLVAKAPEKSSRRNAVAREYRAMVTEYVRQTKKESSCTICGEKDWRCLDFHHTDPATKLFGVGHTGTRRLEAVQAEIAKCKVVCANCHRKLHAPE